MFPQREAGPMGAVAGRSQAPWRGQATKNLQGQVPENIHASALEAANAMGISIAHYLALLVETDAAQNFVRPQGPFVQEELPVSA